MAQLIQMRQRIKAIETIKKITHAMRLISMSMHSRLRNKMPLLKNYKHEVSNLFDKIRFTSKQWTNPVMYPEEGSEENPLIIIVGSQKGLCGTFNIILFNEFEQTIKPEELKKAKIIAVGKRAVDYIQKKEVNLIKSYNDLTVRTITTISQDIVEEIVQAKVPYTSVRIASNELKTFFLQKPTITNLVPLEKEIEQDFTKELADDYIWEQKPNDLLDNLAPQYIGAHINYIIFESLLGEQAARFLSMDMANRNAKTLLEETQLQYNKIRQWKITKELTELAASL